jgi:hypothetical protein
MSKKVSIGNKEIKQVIIVYDDGEIDVKKVFHQIDDQVVVQRNGGGTQPPPPPTGGG